MNVGLLVVSTGKYKTFLNNLFKSADQFFLKGHNVTYYLFTDELQDIEFNRPVIQTIIEHKPWPYPTLLRYKHFSNNESIFNDIDYVYYVDSDMIFENIVGDEIFDDVVSVAHPWFIGNRGTPEDSKESLAYIPNQVNFQYTAGAFFGGKKECMMNMFSFISRQIDIDYSRGIIAKWHDESHSNKFFILYSTKMLSPEYCYNKQSPYCTNVTKWVPRIVQVVKNDNEIRS
jgi:histo-blood group ABO system transferase